MADETQVQYPPKPWWAPDAQGFVIAAIVVYVGIALFYRMTHPVEVNDKLLDMMLTILFGTAFVGIVNYLIGASRGTDAKDAAQSRILEKVTTGPPPLPLPPAPVAWWNRMTDAERTSITAASVADPGDAKLAAIATGPMKMKPDPDEIAYLVTKNLLTQSRATEIQA